MLRAFVAIVFMALWVSGCSDVKPEEHSAAEVKEVVVLPNSYDGDTPILLATETILTGRPKDDDSTVVSVNISCRDIHGNRVIESWEVERLNGRVRLFAKPGTQCTSAIE